MTTGVLPLNVLKALMYSNTGFFETSQTNIDEAWKITVGNYDGAGISQGPSQMNFDFGDPLSLILRNVYNNHRAIWDTVFAPYPTEKQQLYDAIFVKTQAEKIAWADGISYVDASQEKRGLNAPWIPIFQAFAMEQDYRDEYVEVVNVQYYPRVEKLFRSMACTSRMSFATFYDLSVNRGRYYPVLNLLADFEEIDADTNLTDDEKEAQKVYQANIRANAKENGITSTTYVSRRTCMANMGGDYFGTTYDPEVQFDINLEPALVEKAEFIKGVKEMSFGETKIKKVNLGLQPLFEEPFYTSEAPQTQFRTLEGSWEGIANQSVVTLDAGQSLWIDVQNWLGTRLYYTTDGSTPTTSSQRYTEALTFDTSVTLKTLAVSVYGVTEAIKTLAVTVAVAGVTTISPTSTTQNTIPFTVTLTNNQGNVIFYKVGAGTQQTYAGPFTVNQTTNNVGVNILVTYWSTGETEKTITYNTAGAIPGKPVVTATPGTWYVRLDWPATANTTSYSVYRSTVSGQLGTLVSEPYQAGVGFDDNTAQNGTTYYYTVRSANYGSVQSSDQVLATPNTIQAPTSYRYVRYIGYGDNTNLATSRLVEIQAMHGATNRLYLKLPMAGYATPNGGAIAVATNGEFLQASGYPLWWSGQGIPDLKYDMLDWYAIDTIKIAGYSKTTDVRQTKFIIQVSVDNATWVTVADYSANTTPQPETGFSFAVT